MMDQTRLDTVAAAFRAGAKSYAAMGSPPYAALCAGGADDPAVVELAAHAMAGSQPVFHLMASVHHLLLQDGNDPLAGYFATLTDDPLPPGEAWPHFVRFCEEHRAELLHMLATHSVQTTYVERCVSLVAPIAWVAQQAGEPLHLVEIGCSAGVLLTYDRYAYAFEGHDPIGPADAPLLLKGRIAGDPPLAIPRIASRTGLDLHPVDARSKEERRWIIAQTFPEYREQRARLATALDIVAQSDIEMHGGDALAVLPSVLANLPDPVCIFHSACLYYWSDEAKAALDALLCEASRSRDIYRVGVEASARFNAWHKGRATDEARNDQDAVSSMPSGEITITAYRVGEMHGRVAAETSMSGPIQWIG